MGEILNNNLKGDQIKYTTKDNKVKFELSKKFCEKDIADFDFFASYEDKLDFVICSYDLDKYKGFTENSIIYKHVTFLSKKIKLQVYKNTSVKKCDYKIIKTVIYNSIKQGCIDNVFIMSTIQFNQIPNYIVFVMQACSFEDYKQYYNIIINNLDNIKYEITEENIANINANIEKLEEDKNAAKHYEIPDGGDFNIYLKYSNNLDLNNIENYFKCNNINVDVDVEKNIDSMWIGITSKEQNVNISIEKYDFDDDLKNELLEEIDDKEKLNIIKQCNSNYFAETHSINETILLYYLVLYFLKQTSDILILDNYNGVYLNESELEEILNNN